MHKKRILHSILCVTSFRSMHNPFRPPGSIETAQQHGSPTEMLSSMLQNMQSMVPSMGNMPMNPGKHGMIAFGVGKDKHGRNVARFGKVIKNDAGETTEEKFMEKCLDPEREKIAEKSPEAVDEGNCIEVEAEGANECIEVETVEVEEKDDGNGQNSK